jgi:protein gp37
MQPIDINNQYPMYVFVAPRGDLFHPEIPEVFREAAFFVMSNLASQHRYIVLTKRYNEMHDFMKSHPEFNKDNIFLGHSIATKEDAYKMLPVLVRTPAAKRMISIEPMLEDINLWFDYGQGVGDLVADNLDWVIAGCESGSRRRHVDIDAFRDLRNQCKANTTRYARGIPLFLKQIEENGKVVHMPLLDGKIWDEKPF